MMQVIVQQIFKPILQLLSNTFLPQFKIVDPAQLKQK